MSDEKPINHRNVELTTDDAIEFLNSFGPTTPCPHCGTDEWTINFTPGDGQYVEFTTRPQVGAVAYGIGVYFVICNTCGLTRTHTINALSDWKKNKGRAR